ncbi:MAG: PepSY domain-containing protein [Candidatus Promineifilaceae bacterium]
MNQDFLKGLLSVRKRPQTALLWAGLAVFLFAITIFLVSDAFARTENDSDGVLIADNEDEAILYQDRVEINAVTGVPVAMYQVNYPVQPASLEAMAEQYLRENAVVLGLRSAELNDLVHKATRESLSGATVRYRQFVGDIPVYKGEVDVHINNNNEVTLFMANYRPSLALDNLVPTISAEEARQLAFDYLSVTGDLYYDKTTLTVYDYNNTTRLAYQVRVETSAPAGSWEVLVDAHTGELFKVADEAYYNLDYEVNNEPVIRGGSQVDGSGYVFDPDPLTSAMATYGDTGFTDNGDATSSQLDAERSLVTLNDIELDSGTYTLRGPWAEIIDFESPFKGLFQQSSDQFLFDRSDDAFEAVNTYYHIDYYLRYLNNTLGLTIEPYQYPGGVQYDPSGYNGADNSHYLSGSGRLAFGEGGVDDAEDSDVVDHELGHGLHDWVTNGGLSQVNGLSEGIGDFNAQSYNRAHESWTPSDPEYQWVFRWDGHNPFWSGRVTNYPATWPGGLVGEVHADGQIWATCMMKVWDALGGVDTDVVHWEGIGMTNSSTNQSQAANAVYQAAIDLGYSNADLEEINTLFASCGYDMPELPIPDFNLVNQSGDLEVCRPDSAVYSVAVNSLFGFNEVVTLSLSGEPSGATVDFSPNGTNAPFTSTLTISNTAAASVGDYDLEISGVSVSGTHTTTVGLSILDIPSAISLTTPTDGATEVSTTPTFEWQSDAMAATYTLEVATDAGFTNIVLSETGLTGTSYTVSSPLDSDTTYYWRVQGSGTCGTGAYSAVFDFTTVEDYFIYMPAVMKPE